MALWRKFLAEFLGTALLLACVVGSGIMGANLSQGNDAIALLAHAMFELPRVQPGARVRTGQAQWLSEAVATFALVLTILLGLRHRPSAVAALVASYIFAAYWFTASTSFANPAVTIARSLTQTFAGIRPSDVAVFVLAQGTGALAAVAVATTLLKPAYAERSTPTGRE